jgi:hypothetical protein
MIKSTAAAAAAAAAATQHQQCGPDVDVAMQFAASAACMSKRVRLHGSWRARHLQHRKQQQQQQ